jgi:hypothetical protein
MVDVMLNTPRIESGPQVRNLLIPFGHETPSPSSSRPTSYLRRTAAGLHWQAAQKALFDLTTPVHRSREGPGRRGLLLNQPHFARIS